MASGEHFSPGIPLNGSLSLTPSDLDTSTSALLLANGRTLFFLGDTPPTVMGQGPQGLILVWLQPTTVNGIATRKVKVYNADIEDWVLVTVGFPDKADIPDGSIPLSALYATAADLGKVPVVKFESGVYVPRWSTYFPQNLPVGNLAPGSANQMPVTNPGATGVIWTSLTSYIQLLGKPIPLSGLQQAGATVGQVMSWNGLTWVPINPLTPTTPELITAPWTPAETVEVYSTDSNSTIRKPRKNLVDTLPADLTDGSPQLTSKLLGWIQSSTEANLFSINDVATAIQAVLEPAVLDSAKVLFPKKFYTLVYDMDGTGSSGVTPAALVSGIAHGLGLPAMSMGGTITVTATGMAYPLEDIIFVDTGAGTQPAHKYSVQCDSSKIYTSPESVSPSVSIGAGFTYPYIKGSFAAGDYKIRLFAYL